MKTKIIIIIILLAMVASYWMVESIVAKQDQHQNSAQTPDSFIHDVTYTRTNNDGQISDELTAKTVYHFSKNDTSRLITPVLRIYEQGKPPWIITAKLAIATNGREKIVLKDNVIITQQNSNGATVLTTEELTVWPNRKYAITLDPVTINQPGSIVHSLGLTANFNTGNIHLLSNAKGKYLETNPQKKS